MHDGPHFLYVLNIFPNSLEPRRPESGSLSKHTQQEKG